jgi:hypothetical protein
LFCFFLSGRVVFLGDGEFLLHPFLSYSVWIFFFFWFI